MQGPASSVLSAGARATDLVDAAADGSTFNAFPTTTGALDGAGDVGHVLDVDYKGSARNGVADVGAFVVAAANPSTLIEGCKVVDVEEEGGEGEGEGEGEAAEGEGEGEGPSSSTHRRPDFADAI